MRVITKYVKMPFAIMKMQYIAIIKINIWNLLLFVEYQNKNSMWTKKKKSKSQN